MKISFIENNLVSLFKKPYTSTSICSKTVVFDEFFTLFSKYFLPQMYNSFFYTQNFCIDFFSFQDVAVIGIIVKCTAYYIYIVSL